MGDARARERQDRGKRSELIFISQSGQLSNVARYRLWNMSINQQG